MWILILVSISTLCLLLGCCDLIVFAVVCVEQEQNSFMCSVQGFEPDFYT